ncbi:Mu transposase C-terminal domain-containing protein [Azospirillum aestuarii]|uniref:Mu transposase C-terminal domain-containing protein n=1 Tax=Azospirillum aestuarii TaxID=2802052 RepID=UPI004054CA2D
MNWPVVNQLLQAADDGPVERVLWVHPEGGGCYVIDVRDDSAFPLFRSMRELTEHLEQGALRFLKDDCWLAPLSDAGIPAKHREKRDALWTMIRPLVLDEPAIFEPAPRGRAILQLVVEKQATKQTIYRLLRRYWQRGMIPNALLPDFHRCGAPGKERPPGEVKRGRPPKGGIKGINIDRETRAIFRAAITKYFAENQKFDLRGVYDLVIAEHYSDRMLSDATGRIELVPREHIPQFWQFRYWYERDNDVFQVDRIRRKPRVYDKDRRALLDTSTSEVLGPASRYQIDATIADIYLVSRLRRTKIVGRPVLYIVIDVFSRMIVGVYVGFEGPSWVGAMMALANAASDKVAYCRQFGIDIEAHDWPCCSLPDVLLGDRGEILGSMIDTLSSNFNVQIENAAPYRGDWKGIVEQRFRLIPAKFKAYAPGYIAQDYRARGGSDYRLDATLDIDQFTRIIIHCILYYNNAHLLRDYDKSAAMIADDVPGIPADLWEWGVARRSGKLRVFPEEQVKLSLLPSDDAVVTAQGIRFQGCFYTCPQAIAEHWFERARQRGIWKVRVSYEPRLIDEIYLHEDTGRIRFIPCGLTNRSRAFQGRTLWEIDQIRQEEQLTDSANQPRELAGRLNLTDAIKTIVGEAESMRPEVTASDRERVAGIRANRQEERRENQAREAFRSTKAPPESPTPDNVVPFTPNPPAEEDYSLPSIADILNRFGEGGDDDQGRR